MYEKWFAMEQFYYTVFPTALLGLSLLLFIAMLSGANLHTQISKRIFALCCVLMIGIGSYTAYQYYVHRDLIARTRYLSAATRQFARKFYYDLPYSLSEVEFYERAKLLKHFEQIGMYEKAVASERVEYLGRDAHQAYFKIEGKIFGNNINAVVFTDDVQFAERNGNFYRLNDSRFATELGFIPESKVYFTEYRVPKALEQLQVSKADEDAAQPPSDRIQRWIY